MASDIRLLEELVAKAVDRLKQVSRERDDLRQEVGKLRRRVGDLEGQLEGPGGNGDREPAWLAERDQVVSVLKETLTELRGS